VTVDGHAIAFQEAGPAHGQAVVLIHGLASDSQTWDKAIGPMAEYGLRVIAIDLLGHGRSDKPAGGYLLSDFARQLHGLFREIGLRRATLCGHSLGGAIAVHFGYHYPQRVERLVLVSAGGLGREVSLSLRMLTLPGAEALTGAVMGRRTVQRILRSPRVHRLLRVPPERLVNLRRIGRCLLHADLREAFFRSLRGVIAPSGQRGSFLEMEYLGASLPTLLVWSDRDAIIPVRHAHATHAYLPGSRLVVLPGRSHEPHRIHAAQVADEVCAFLSMRELDPAE
jgi:pimeloyl-ACP methyl ester carboxylesterase